MSNRETISFEYPCEATYPDLLDLERVLRWMSANSVLRKHYKPVKLFQDFASTFDWMHHVLPCCHYHGKHGFESVLDVKDVVEKFVGRRIQDDAFLAACHERGLTIKRASGARGEFFHDLEIKVPCLDRAMEVLPRWNEYILERKEREEKKNGN